MMRLATSDVVCGLGGWVLGAGRRHGLGKARHGRRAGSFSATFVFVARRRVDFPS